MKETIDKSVTALDAGEKKQMMKLADYIGEDYTEQKARNFLLHEAIGFLKMLQEENGNI